MNEKNTKSNISMKIVNDLENSQISFGINCSHTIQFDLFIECKTYCFHQSNLLPNKWKVNSSHYIRCCKTFSITNVAWKHPIGKVSDGN